jgi:hypothetical protein
VKLYNSMIILVVTSFSEPLFAIDCVDYNSMGPPVGSMEELSQHRITREQISVVRENTALKASRVAALQLTPMALKLKSIMNDQALLAELASGTSTLVRADCFKNPGKGFYEAVSDQFEYVVEYMANKHGL